jgi:hypothetical protein
MTDKIREMLRYNLYITAGLLAGLAIGISVGPRLRDFVFSIGWPKESIDWLTWALIWVSIMINGLLWQRLKKVDRRESVIANAHRY